MKKIISVLLILCVLFSCFNVFAEESLREENVSKLILLSKEKLNISDDLYEFKNYYEGTTDNKFTYTFYWENKNEKNKGISVVINEKGEIISFYKNYINDYKVSFLNYSKEEAKNFADKFLDKIEAPKSLSAPQIAKNGNYYNIIYYRIHNDIKVDQNYINCIISGDTGEVVSYNLTWNELEFKDTDYISREEAKEIYKEKLGYNIFYTVKNENYESKAKLVYRPNFEETAYIEATTGKIKTYRDLYLDSKNKYEDAIVSESVKAGGNAILSPEEKKLLEEIKNLINEEEALKEIKKIEEFEIDDNYKVDYFELFKKANGKYTANINLVLEKEDLYDYKSFSLEADSKKITNYYSSYNNYVSEDKKENFDNEEGRKRAEDFLKKHYKDEFSEMIFSKKLSETNGTYEYKKVVNGIKVSNNGISVSIDLNTGKIKRMNLTEDDADFYINDKIADLNKVYDKLFVEDNFDLKYLIIRNNDKEYVPVLVYCFKNTPIYDAENLKEVLSYSLEPINESEKPVYTDIEGHYSEKYVNKLLEEGIYLEGNELKPENPITYKEYTSLLYMVLSGTDPMPLNELYKDAKNYFYEEIKEEIADEPIKRIDALKLLLNKMGYEEFAKIKGIFNCPFEDIDESDKGYGAIAAGLGLVSTADSKFYKDDNLKRCDALIIIYNYMSR